jgi:hypothetical protein
MHWCPHETALLAYLVEGVVYAWRSLCLWCGRA